jgi:hypothetical protein
MLVYEDLSQEVRRIVNDLLVGGHSQGSLKRGDIGIPDALRKCLYGNSRAIVSR